MTTGLQPATGNTLQFVNTLRLAYLTAIRFQNVYIKTYYGGLTVR